MYSCEQEERETARLKSMNVLTRAGRKRAGLQPPSPVFKDVKPHVSNSTVQPRTAQSKAGLKQGLKLTKECKSPLKDDATMIWVQCDECKKWRKIKNSDKSSSTLSSGDEWYCRMNSSPNHNTCDSVEEAYHSLPRGLIYTYKGLTPGQLVWGKMKTYPPWPAIVTPDPYTDNNYIEEVTGGGQCVGGGCIYHVEFLGRQRTHIWLPEEMVEPYRSDSCSIGSINRGVGLTKLRQAISEADSLQEFSNTERLEKCLYIPGKVGRPKRVPQSKDKRGRRPIQVHGTQSKDKKVVEKKKRVRTKKPSLSSDIVTPPSPKLHSSGTVPTPQAVPPTHSLTTNAEAILNKPNMVPVVMATGLQVLQMLGVSINDLNSNGCHDNSTAFPTETTPSTTSQLINKDKIHTTGKENPLQSLGTSASHKRTTATTIRGKGRGSRRGCVPLERLGQPRPSITSSRIERYFTSNKTTTKTNICTVTHNNDITNEREPLTTPTNQSVDQLVPESVVSLDDLAQETMDELTIMESMLQEWDNEDTHKQQPLESVTISNQAGHQQSFPTLPSSDHDIQSLLHELQELEDKINAVST